MSVKGRHSNAQARPDCCARAIGCPIGAPLATDLDLGPKRVWITRTGRVEVIYLGFPGRDGEIRTRGLLLPNQLHPVARRSLPSPDVALNCGNAGWMSPDVAW